MDNLNPKGFPNDFNTHRILENATAETEAEIKLIDTLAETLRSACEKVDLQYMVFIGQQKRKESANLSYFRVCINADEEAIEKSLLMMANKLSVVNLAVLFTKIGNAYMKRKVGNGYKG